MILRLVEGEPIITIVNVSEAKPLMTIETGLPSTRRKDTSRVMKLTTRGWVYPRVDTRTAPEGWTGPRWMNGRCWNYRLQSLRSGLCRGGCCRSTVLRLQCGSRGLPLSFGAWMTTTTTATTPTTTITTGRRHPAHPVSVLAHQTH